MANEDFSQDYSPTLKKVTPHWNYVLQFSQHHSSFAPLASSDSSSTAEFPFHYVRLVGSYRRKRKRYLCALLAKDCECFGWNFPYVRMIECLQLLPIVTVFAFFKLLPFPLAIGTCLYFPMPSNHFPFFSLTLHSLPIIWQDLLFSYHSRTHTMFSSFAFFTSCFCHWALGSYSDLRSAINRMTSCICSLTTCYQ